MFDLSSACYNVMLFIVLLQRFICMGTIQTCKVDLISQRYYSHYIIKFVCYMSIYYVINLYIVLSCMVFRYLYFGSINLLQISIDNIIFHLKKKG